MYVCTCVKSSLFFLSKWHYLYFLYFNHLIDIDVFNGMLYSHIFHSWLNQNGNFPIGDDFTYWIYIIFYSTKDTTILYWSRKIFPTFSCTSPSTMLLLKIVLFCPFIMHSDKQLLKQCLWEVIHGKLSWRLKNQIGLSPHELFSTENLTL